MNLHFQFSDGPVSWNELLENRLVPMEASDPNTKLYQRIGPDCIAPFKLQRMYYWPGSSRADRFRLFLLGAMNRNTSRDSDELICIAVLMDIDPTVLFGFPLDKRMPLLLRLIGSFPGEIIFSEGPRLASKGFGWAPQTFIRRYHNNKLHWYSTSKSQSRTSDCQRRPLGRERRNSTWKVPMPRYNGLPCRNGRGFKAQLSRSSEV